MSRARRALAVHLDAIKAASNLVISAWSGNLHDLEADLHGPDPAEVLAQDLDTAFDGFVRFLTLKADQAAELAEAVAKEGETVDDDTMDLTKVDSSRLFLGSIAKGTKQ